MLRSRVLGSIFSVGLVVLGADVVSSQEYPNRPIRIVTAAIGAGNDFSSRQIAGGISGSLGQPVIVDNRPQTHTVEIVLKAPADGYTLYVEGADLWVLPLLKKMPYEVLRDFAPISQIDRAIYVAVVHPAVPVNSIKELIALAKAKPGELNYGAGSTGGTTHLASALLASMAGINVVRVPFKGTALAVVSLLAGEIQFMITGAGPVVPHIKSGKLRGLAVSSAEPSTLVPWLPTVAASGLPGYEAVSISGIFAPAKTPAPIIKRLNQEIVRFLHSAEAKEKFFNAGVEVVGSSPEQFAAAIKSETARLDKLIKEAGIKVD